MFQSTNEEPLATPLFNLPFCNQESVCHILLGDYSALIGGIHQMDRVGYCVGKVSPKGFRLAWSAP